MTDQAGVNEKLWSMIRQIGVAMMTTDDGEVLRARPMAAVDADFDGTLWFFSRASSHKTEELGRDHRVGLAYAEPRDNLYVSLSGQATLVRDPEAIRAHWHESIRTWFPKGPDDPDIALLRVAILQGEYWDAPSSTMVHLYGYVKATLTGQPPRPGDHAFVSTVHPPHG